jgi:hypothetical protein
MKVNYDGHEHEHELEPAYGLPEALPSNEKVLWQGSPDWRATARQVFFLRALTIYFVAILAIRGTLVLVDGGTAMAALKAVLEAWEGRRAGRRFSGTHFFRLRGA